MTGYVKVHRKLLKTSFNKRPLVLSLFVHLLLNASHKDQEFLWNSQTIKLKAGQLITGRIQLSKQTGISQQTIRTSLNALKSTNTITIKSTKRFSLISIVNWSKYQDSQPTHQPTHQPKPNQDPTTYKNDKKDNKYIGNSSNTGYLLDLPDIDLDEFTQVYECTRQEAIDKAEEIYNWLTSKGITKEDYRAYFVNILNKNFGKKGGLNGKTFKYPRKDQG